MWYRSARCIIAVTVGGIIASSFTSPALAKPSPRPTDKVAIDVVHANGSGCRPGTAVVGVSEDNTAFTVTYSDYIVEVGADAKKKDLQKDCRLDLKVRVPKDFTYAIDQIDYRGFAHLEPGATGRERASYYFPGSSRPAPVDHTFKGPFSDDWLATDIPSLVFSPCGKQRHLNIDTELSVSAGGSGAKTATSFISMDSTDGSVKTTYHLAWKKC